MVIESLFSVQMGIIQIFVKFNVCYSEKEKHSDIRIVPLKNDEIIYIWIGTFAEDQYSTCVL